MCQGKSHQAVDQEVSISSNGRGEMRVELEIQAEVLIIFRSGLVYAHVFSALKASQEFAHSYIKLPAISCCSESLKRVANSLRVSKINETL